MSNPWFRLYAEFATDPKVQILSEQDQRRLIMVLCMRCNGDVTLQDKHVTFQLRITAEEWAISKGVFIDAGFIDIDNNVLNWDKRQYISDTSKDRVAKHRALHKNVTVTPCNVTVTSPEQNRTDTEQIHSKSKPLSEYSDEFEQFWKAYPKKTGKGAAYVSWKKQKPNIDGVLKSLAWQKKLPEWIKDNGQFIPMPATYLNQRRWEDGGTEISDKPVENKCGYPGCTRTANVRTSNGHRCVEHIAK